MVRHSSAQRGSILEKCKKRLREDVNGVFHSTGNHWRRTRRFAIKSAFMKARTRTRLPRTPRPQGLSAAKNGEPVRRLREVLHYITVELRPAACGLGVRPVDLGAPPPRHPDLRRVSGSVVRPLRDRVRAAERRGRGARSTAATRYCAASTTRATASGASRSPKCARGSTTARISRTGSSSTGPAHYRRLMAFRKDTPAGPPVADARRDRAAAAALVSIASAPPRSGNGAGGVARSPRRAAPGRAAAEGAARPRFFRLHPAPSRITRGKDARRGG
jgi:hypothetical protein